MGIDECVGMNIRKYRLAYKLTLEELAGKIHKSKSTMSKYEKGTISLDVATLEEVAGVFGISPAQLMASVPSNEGYEGTRRRDYIDKQYMYSYDGRARRIFKSVLERYEVPGSGQMEITMFYDVQDMKNWGECKALYAGYSKKYEFIENFRLQNQNNPTEQVSICCINSLSRTNRKIGLLSGLSYKTMLPVAMKVMISTSILKEDNDLVSTLLLTKEDIKISRKYNLFTINEFTE